MGKFYKQVCKDLKWPEDKALSKKLEEENKNYLKKLESFTKPLRPQALYDLHCLIK